MKNHRRMMKTHLNTRTSQKTLKEESKGLFDNFGVPFKSAELASFGFWPNGLRVMIRHTIFDLFAKECVQIQTLIVHAYILESSGLYK